MRDRMEDALPNAGIIYMQDAETGRVMAIDSSSKAVRRQFEQNAKKRNEELASELRGVKVDFINIKTGEPYIHDIVKFFRMRRKRR